MSAPLMPELSKQPAAVIPSITLPVPSAEARTVNCVDVECANKPDLPATFKVNVPGLVANPGLTVISDDVGLPKNGVTEFGLNDALTPAAPDTLRVTGALNSRSQLWDAKVIPLDVFIT